MLWWLEFGQNLILINITLYEQTGKALVRLLLCAVTSRIPNPQSIYLFNMPIVYKHKLYHETIVSIQAAQLNFFFLISTKTRVLGTQNDRLNGSCEDPKHMFKLIDKGKTHILH